MEVQVSKTYSLDELAGHVGGEVRGRGDRQIRGISTLEQAGPDDLSFLANVRYMKQARKTRAGAVLVGKDSGLESVDLLEVREPYLALAILIELFHPPKVQRPEISPEAYIAAGVEIGKQVAIGPFAVVQEGARLGDGVIVGAGCVVGENCTIGERTELKPRVVLYPETVVGRRCIIHSGVVLGSDGFGFATSGGTHRKIAQVGRAVIEDDVEIGANSTVDRAAMGDTVIGGGSKLDNLVMIAHGVRLGKGALMAAQSGIAGSTRVGEGTTWAGQSGAAGHLVIGDGALVAAKTAVLKDLPAGAFVIGIPAVEHRSWKRERATLGKLPELRRELQELRSRLKRLEGRLEEEEG
jgi:UDP-3-O-[3-hydroxymyristoyl] glucosamine N-acyltransferase